MGKDDADGAELLEGRDLRTAAKQLAKGPMKFAFGFKDPRTPVLLLAKNKSANALRNELKKVHKVTKATHGMASAEDKTLVLAVEGPDIPNMDRMVKVLLRKEKVGKLTETRVEVAEDAERLAEEDEEEVALATAPRAAAAAASASATAPETDLEELRALQARIQQLEGPIATALQRVVQGGGDPRPIQQYVGLCTELGRRARGCGDAALVAFAMTALERAKRMSTVLERAGGQAAASSAPAARSSSAASALEDVPAGVTVEGGKGDNSVGVKKTGDGIEISFKHEKSLPLFAKNFKVWVIPCYTKGGLKASIEGTGMIGKTDGVQVAVKGAGSMELGVGGTSEVVTAGPYGSIELSAGLSSSVKYSEGSSEAPDGWTVEPFTVSVNGTGKVGVKVEVEDGPKLDVSQEVANWELFVIRVGRYTKGQFEAIDVRAGKDLERLIAALEQAGPRIEAAVEQYAPQFVKDGAVDAAEWAAEDETSKEIYDAADKIFQDVKKDTGVDVGGGVEEIVQSLVDENGETAAEATRRYEKEAETFNATQEDLHAVMGASGLKGELRPFRSADEYNAIIDVWQAEGELLVKGKPAPGKWRGMVEELVKVARQRQAQAKAQQAAQKKADDDRAQEVVRAAVAAMEAARPGAQGQGNVLNNRLQKTPNATAQSFFQKGWQDWAAAEAARQQVAGLSGEAKAQRAREAMAAYERARATFTTGIQHL